MIAADKNRLKATLTQGVMQIQNKLIVLYTSNLNAIAGQTALIAGFAYTGYIEAPYPGGHTNYILQYFYHTIDVIALVSALFCVSQATIVSIFGPSMALTAESPDAMIAAVGHMKNQQSYVLKVGIVACTSLFIATALLCFAKPMPIPCAAMCTLIFIVVYILMVVEGKKAYDMFHIPKKEISNAGKDRHRSSGQNTEQKADSDDEMDETARLSLVEASHTKAQGMIFWRGSLSSGGTYSEVFCSVGRGAVDFFKKKSDFLNNENPLNKKPIKLWQYKLETNYRNFDHENYTSLRSAVLGQSDFSLQYMMQSPHDLKEAAKKYKFALLPKVFSELNALEPIMLMASDEQSYRLWITAFSKIISALDQLKELEGDGAHDPKKGVMKVEAIVQAANSVKL